MDGNVREGATISGNMMREKPSDGVKAPICGNMCTSIGTGQKTSENAAHRSLQPSENIKFLEEQLGIDLGGWQSPDAESGRFLNSRTDTPMETDTTAHDAGESPESERTGETDAGTSDTSPDGKPSDDNEPNAKAPKAKRATEPRIRAFQNYGEYASEIASAIKNAPHNAKVKMRWACIIATLAISAGIAAASIAIPARAASERREIAAAIESYSRNGKAVSTVTGFAKYADSDGIARATELEIAAWRENAKALDPDSLAVSDGEKGRTVSYRLDGATVEASIAEKADGGKKVSSVSIALDGESKLSDGVLNGTPTETDGTGMKKVKLTKASDGDIEIIDGFSFHIPDGFAESYKGDLDDGGKTIDRRYAMDGNGEISVGNGQSDAHPDSITDTRQAEILRNAWNKTVASSASSAGRQADRDTQFAGYTIDFGNGAFGYVSEYATANGDGTARKTEARILITKGKRKATITYTRDGNSDMVPIGEIMKMIRSGSGKK